MRSLFTIAFVLISVGLSAQNIATWAGNGPGGGSDGVGDNRDKDSAQFTDPGNGFFDRWGNYYVAEQLQHRIRKIDTLGVIISIAGTGSAGYNGDGGLANVAALNHPVAVISDSIGNVYLSDAVNYRIRKIDNTTGFITTIAGTGIQGYSGDNGPAQNAQLNIPSDIWFDGHGNMLVADNTHVRKINSTGTITTIAGNGKVSSSVNGGFADTSAIGGITGICTDDQDNIFLVDGYNALIYKINSVGIITVAAGTLAGYLYNGDGITATSAQILPNKIRVEKKSGNLFFTDSSPNNRVRMIDVNGIIHTVVGNGSSSYSGNNGPATDAGIPYPSGLAFDNCGNLYIPQVVSPAHISKVTFDTSCHIHVAHGVGVNNVTAFKDIKIYPNPATDVLHVEVAASMQYRLMSIVGTVVQQGALKSGSNAIAIDALASGVYVLEVSDAMQRVIKKIVIRH